MHYGEDMVYPMKDRVYPMENMVHPMEYRVHLREDRLQLRDDMINLWEDMVYPIEDRVPCTCILCRMHPSSPDNLGILPCLASLQLGLTRNPQHTGLSVFR